MFVYPEIRCAKKLVFERDPLGLGFIRMRWKLLPPTELVPPVTPLPEGPQPEVGPIVQPILPDEKGGYHIRAALWKQSDGYFVVGPGGSRYDPETITGYNVQSDFSVDEQKLGRIEDSDKIWRMLYCGPNNMDQRFHPPELSTDCVNAIPIYESERIDVITLKLEVKPLIDEGLPVKKPK